MSKKPLCVAILWHMHQPDYSNVLSGDIYLPWTRFHATKDYFDMAALVAETPGMHLTINVVPSLMDQLDDYGRGAAHETYEAITLRNADSLDEREKSFLLRKFFQLPYKHMLDPYPRYHELLERRGVTDDKGEYGSGLRDYAARDYRDLQVWFNLSWCGAELRKDPEIATLFAKGKGYAEEEKKRLIELQHAHMGRILPLYRRLMESGQVELSVSPYYHPILPLLCDNRAARDALPTIALPGTLFAHPGDAKEQVRRAKDRFRQAFGLPPAGMWPSEGSLSDATASLAREEGLRWLASDEAVLGNTLRKAGRVGDRLPDRQKFNAYSWGPGADGPCLFFRDHGLSDLIGFTYSRWRAEDAAADLVERLRRIHNELPDEGRHFVVPIILDGENAWEHYPNNGADFLEHLYRRLTEASRLRTVTMSEFLDLEPHREKLDSLVAGSWIYGNLATWMGHPEKNRGWELLAEARSFLDARRHEEGDSDRYQAAFQEMMIAEGSDWFWWYGDDHPTQNAADFDALFRGHIKNIYRLLGQTPPAALDLAIKRAEARTQYRGPVHTISPVIDGRVTDYFEWLSAGFATPVAGASMHRSESWIEKIYFGYDRRKFYLRIDLTSSWLRGMIPAEHSLQIQFVSPREFLLLLGIDDERRWHCRVLRASVAGFMPEFAGAKILELGVPLEELGIDKPEEVRFSFSAFEKERELERFPSHGFLAVTVDPWSLNQQEWMV
jgi:alpha-amylase/alpha-mannosidase (GH57 family)